MKYIVAIVVILIFAILSALNSGSFYESYMTMTLTFLVFASVINTFEGIGK